jgi:hypothetical protein
VPCLRLGIIQLEIALQAAENLSLTTKHDSSKEAEKQASHR